MRITREIIAPGHRWRAIDDRRMEKICKDVKQIISDFLGPQITRTQTSIRKYIDRECDQCSEFTDRQERGKCKRCPQEICAFCYHEPKVNIYTDPEISVRIMGEPFEHICRPCHKESCCLDRNAWELIKSFLFVKCDCCSKLMPGAARCGSESRRLRGTWFKCDGCKKNLCTMKNGVNFSCEGPIHCIPCNEKFPRCQYCGNKSHHKTFECPECNDTYHTYCPFSGMMAKPDDETKCAYCLQIEEAEVDMAEEPYNTSSDEESEEIDEYETSEENDPSAW